MAESVETIQTLCVSISGVAFSLLAYDNVRSKYDQEGFLLGEIIEKKTNSITDHDGQITKIDRTMKINSTIPCPKLGHFYDAAGSLNKDTITSFLGNQLTNRVKVVAWYKFKHINSFKMTLREKIVHKNLAQYFAADHPELFACCLLTTDTSPNGATHTYAQTFLRYVNSSYQMIPMHIVNLSDPSNAYKSMEPSSDAFKELTKSLQIDGQKVQGSVTVTRINDELQRQTEEKVKELAEKEKQCFKLEEEVRMLMEQLKKKMLSKEISNTTESGKVDSTSCGDSACSMDGTNMVENTLENASSNRRSKTVETPNTVNVRTDSVSSRLRRRKSPS